ncbi:MULTISPECIES: PdxA family dehydrogenase [Halomonadaceae]|jgi:4-hydroxythreonine-4-phosphate dehydrogenase|uniref:4-hydroxythreonine-4-phosphate dehydrogenase PdxA n=1 Tax=Vreelandella piezotolerans TaxID=2609667 RepID=A0ABQ6X7B0_9GAMM|nr:MULTISPECIES: 4-hydroxythreonine-4-phosphate dehydrogenase PdxA [Halomonas]KAE8436910.1 4-hydroxythreonine-4-phosphate dehydrogenase PdxA [Halomonas piezotolerans]MCE8014319.1 4-hydroxythreonine-4-phosphate dehydrogenase PdxA [Halomonas desiderata]
MALSESRILVSIGDPNGVGPEIAVKAAAALAEDAVLRPVLVGDRHVVEPLSDTAGLRLAEGPEVWGAPGAIDLAPVEALDPTAHRPGEVSAAAGQATVDYIRAALDLYDRGLGRAIIGCPHSETAVNATGREFSGYPSLLAELRGTGPDSVFMMLVGGGLRIVHVTLHEGILGALNRITPELIEKASMAGVEALKALGIAVPRIGLFGFNPHASEGGLFGPEDLSIVTPARVRLAARGVDVEGPVGADTMLAMPGFDAFVCMYHDQGHIPVKLLAGRTASALAIGGGVLFSSVGHGAAFDIAGQNIADPEAILRTIRLLGGRA